MFCSTHFLSSQHIKPLQSAQKVTVQPTAALIKASLTVPQSVLQSAGYAISEDKGV